MNFKDKFRIVFETFIILKKSYFKHYCSYESIQLVGQDEVNYSKVKLIEGSWKIKAVIKLSYDIVR